VLLKDDVLLLLTWTSLDESKKGNKKGGASSGELDQVTGTAEDEFVDALAYVRERELLYGPNSLLSIFGPIIENICKSNLHFCVSLLL
jgi:condensin complex subunit 1